MESYIKFSAIDIISGSLLAFTTTTFSIFTHTHARTQAHTHTHTHLETACQTNYRGRAQTSDSNVTFPTIEDATHP